MKVGVAATSHWAREKIVAKVSCVLAAALTGPFRISFMPHLAAEEVTGALCYRMTMACQRTAEPEKGDPWFRRRSLSFQITPEPAPRECETTFDQLTMSGQEYAAFDGAPQPLRHFDCRRCRNRNRE